MDTLSGSAVAADGASLAPPLPPEEYRRLVTAEDKYFDIIPDSMVFPEVPAGLYDSVFDFGCGCGRIARQLMCQRPKPRRYAGIDVHKGMVAWCQENLTAYDEAFRFHHHDVYNLGLGPDNTRQMTAAFPAEDGGFTFVVAHSVFTHLYKEQTEFYLREIARILAPGGLARTTWFLFDRSTFPMLFDFQVCLFVNEIDPTNAVIYDWRWLLGAVRDAGLCITRANPALVRGHQWEVFLTKRDENSSDSFPTDPASLHLLCGSGISAEPVAQPAVAPAEPRPVSAARREPGTAFRLRYTGTANEDEFRKRSSELDWWYHSYYFDNGFAVRGEYDIGLDIASYGFPASMEGMRVLDVGTGAGWFAHYFEQKGAIVTTVDARGYCDFDMYGRYENPAVQAGGRQPDRTDEAGNPIYDSPVSRGFWIMKDILKSRIRFRNARIYDLSPELFGGEKFDLVFLGAILCHVRDPIGALMAARKVCRSKVMASVPTVIGEPASETMPRQYLPYTDVDNISWWLPNEACLRHWFLAAGFANVDVGRQIRLTADKLHLTETGRPSNGDQILRVGVGYAF
jgi:SAM-dependent methyltransferase